MKLHLKSLPAPSALLEFWNGTPFPASSWKASPSSKHTTNHFPPSCQVSASPSQFQIPFLLRPFASSLLFQSSSLSTVCAVTAAPVPNPRPPACALAASHLNPPPPPSITVQSHSPAATSSSYHLPRFPPRPPAPAPRFSRS